MAGLEVVFGGPKRATKPESDAKAEGSDDSSGEDVAASAVMSALKSGDSKEFKKGLRAFLRACKDDPEDS